MLTALFVVWLVTLIAVVMAPGTITHAVHAAACAGYAVHTYIRFLEEETFWYGLLTVGWVLIALVDARRAQRSWVRSRA